jgi:hypothetical protein
MVIVNVGNREELPFKFTGLVSIYFLFEIAGPTILVDLHYPGLPN